MLLFVLSHPRRPGASLVRAPSQMGAPVGFRHHEWANGVDLWRHQVCAVCGDFIHGPRTNVMIRHPIRAALRISVSAIARRALRTCASHARAARNYAWMLPHATASANCVGRRPGAARHARSMPADSNPARRRRALTLW